MCLQCYVSTKSMRYLNVLMCLLQSCSGVTIILDTVVWHHAVKSELLHQRVKHSVLVQCLIRAVLNENDKCKY